MASSSPIDCGGNYTTPKGLTFSIFCDRSIEDLEDIDQDTQDNFLGSGVDTAEGCFDLCAGNAFKLCVASVFRADDSRCFLKTANATTLGSTEYNLTEVEGRTLGIASRAQLEPFQSECTEQNETVTTQNSLDFTLYCGQSASGSDMSPGSETMYKSHADSIEECVEHCSTLHPLCTSVDWDASLSYGWLNCYPKNWTASDYNGHRQPSERGVVSTARALFEDIEDVCPSENETTVTAGNGDVFDLSCQVDHPNNNITVQHAASLDTCVDLCTTESTSSCVGVVFDPRMANGYENCYLKFTTGVSSPSQSGFTAAMRQTNSSTDPSSNSPPPNPSPSATQQPTEDGMRAWMAGPIVGAVVAVAIIAAALWWCLRFRARKRGMNSQNIRKVSSEESWEKPELSPETRQRMELDFQVPQRPELGQGVAMRGELDPEASQRVELDSAIANVPTHNIGAFVGFRGMRVNELPT